MCMRTCVYAQSKSVRMYVCIATFHQHKMSSSSSSTHERHESHCSDRMAQDKQSVSAVLMIPYHTETLLYAHVFFLVHICNVSGT